MPFPYNFPFYFEDDPIQKVLMKVRIAFASDPLDTSPTWTDVSSDFIMFYSRRGRQHQLQRMEAGELTVLLDNASGDYWPANAGGTHFPNVLPRKKINVQASFDSGTTYVDRFTGYIYAYNPGFLGRGGKGPVMEVKAVDGLRVIARINLNNAGEAQELSGTRVGNVLDECSFPTGGWTSPTGHNDPDAKYTNEANMYDGNTASYGFCTEEGYYIELTIGSLACSKVRIYANAATASGFEAPSVDIDVYYDGAYHNIHSGAVSALAWETINLPSVENVTKARIKFNNSGLTTGYLYEFEFNGAGREIDAGQTTVIATGAQVNVNARDHLDLVQATELGIVYMGEEGNSIFEDRAHRLKSPHLAPLFIFGDDTGEDRYIQPLFAFDEQLIKNDVRRTRSGGTEQSASDATSQGDYGINTLEKDGLLMPTDAEAADQAEYLRNRYKDPFMRLKGITIQPDKDPGNLWYKALHARISDRVTIRLNAASIDDDFFIEGISDHFDARRNDWKTTYQVSTADDQNYWLIGEAGYSEIGDTTWLGY